MADESTMKASAPGLWSKVASFAPFVVALGAALSAWYSYNVSQDNRLMTISQSAAMYSASAETVTLPSGDEAQDLLLTAPGSAVLPDEIIVIPRFEIPGKFSDEDTLGNEIVLEVGNARDIQIDDQNGKRVLTIVSIGDSICRRGEKNRELCGKDFSVAEYHLQLSFERGTATSKRLTAGPNS